MFGAYTPPDVWNFRPFFTLQPVTLTREKQLKQWKDIILDYYQVNNATGAASPVGFVLDLSSYCLFDNRDIDRRLDAPAARAIAEYLVKCGNAEWDQTSAMTNATGATIYNRLRILLRSPASLAGELHDWAVASNHINSTMFTFYELLHYRDEEGDDTIPIRSGEDAFMLQKAIAALQAQGKAAVIAGATRDEDGIKFL